MRWFEKDVSKLTVYTRHYSAQFGSVILPPPISVSSVWSVGNTFDFRFAPFRALPIHVDQ
jgi:hypothetical protein